MDACLRLADQNAYTFCLALSLRIAACGVFNDSRHKELCYTRLYDTPAAMQRYHQWRARVLPSTPRFGDARRKCMRRRPYSTRLMLLATSNNRPTARNMRCGDVAGIVQDFQLELRWPLKLIARYVQTVHLLRRTSVPYCSRLVTLAALLRGVHSDTTQLN